MYRVVGSGPTAFGCAVRVPEVTAHRRSNSERRAAAPAPDCHAVKPQLQPRLLAGLWFCLLLWPALLSAGSLRFYGNGVNDIDRVKVQIDNPANTNPGPPADVGATDFTIEFWIKGASADNRATTRCGGVYGWIDGNIVVDRDRFNQRRAFGISLNAGRIAFGLLTDTDLWTLCGGRNVLDGQWHHVAVQRALSGALSIYVDGTLDASANGPSGDISYPDNGTPGNYCGPSGGQSCINSDPYLVFGAEKHDAGPAYPSFRGWLDEIRLSTVRRYSGSFPIPVQPFVADAQTAALYHFDEGAGDVITDAAGNRSPGVRRFGGSPPGPEWSADTPFSVASPGALAFQAASYSATESAGTATITVARTGGSSGAASVSYMSSGGTATPGADYQAVSGTLTWGSGDASAKSFTVPVLNDLIDESNETVGITLTGASGAALATPATATLTIVDDDPAPSAGSLQFAASAYSVTEGGNVTATVTRSGGSSGSVSVAYATSNGTASSGSDYAATSGTLSWASGDTGTRTITVPAFTDTALENNETFNLTLSAPAGGASLGSPAQAVITIINATTTNPVPAATGLSPSSATAGDSGLVLTVTGSNFIASSVVRWNGANRPTTFVSASELEASITSADLANEGQATVRVFNPSPGGGTSNALTFSIATNATPNPVPSISGLAPSSAVAGSAGFTLVISGGGFASSAVVRWNGSDRVTTFVSPNELSASIPASDLVSASTASVVVFNPAPGGGISNAASFTIGPSDGPRPLPRLDSLTPNSAPAGQPGATVTINGVDFSPSSIARWNGSNRPTAYLSGTQLQVTLSTSDLASQGMGTITVNTPAPGGGLSGPQTFFVLASGQALFLDHFNRADNSAVGNGWLEKTAAAFALATREVVKQAVTTSDPDNLVYRPAAENLLDAEALVEFRLLNLNVGYPQIFTRVQTGSVTTRGLIDGYILYINDRSGQAIVGRQHGSAPVTLATLTLSRTLDTTSRYRMRLSTRGSSSVVVTALVERCTGSTWEVIGSATYTDISSARISTAGSVGFSGFTEGSYVFDNFARR